MNDHTATVLLLGATGKVGGATLRALLPDYQAGRMKLIVAVHRPEQRERFTNQGLEARLVDLDLAERHGLSVIQPAFEGIDRLLLVTGHQFDMVEQSKAAIDAAKKAGVRQIVHIGACGDDETTIAHWAWHQLVERYIEWHGFQYTHLRLEWYMDNFLVCRSSYVRIDPA